MPDSEKPTEQKAAKSGGAISAIGWLFAVPMAMTLVARLSDEIEFSDILSAIANKWREVTHIIWGDLFAALADIISIHPTHSQMDLLTVSLIMLSVAFVAIVRRRLGAASNEPTILRTPVLTTAVFVLSVAIATVVFVSSFALFFRSSPGISLLINFQTGVILGVVATFVVMPPRPGRNLANAFALAGRFYLVMMGWSMALFLAAPLRNQTAAPDQEPTAVIATTILQSGDTLMYWLSAFFMGTLVLVRVVAPLSLARGIAVMLGIIAADRILVWAGPLIEYLGNAVERAS